MARQGLEAMFSRLPADDLKRLIKAAQNELDKRGPKDLGGMSDEEFRRFVDEQFRNADRAGREADLREQLTTKSKDEPKQAKSKPEDDNERKYPE
jgi:hypothetical protein